MNNKELPSSLALKLLRDDLQLACDQFKDTNMEIIRLWRTARTDKERADILRDIAIGLDDDIICVRNAQDNIYRFLGKE